MIAPASTILVTGAAGDVGRAIVRRLRKDGFRVVGTDRGARPADHPEDQWIGTDLANAEGRARIVAAAREPLRGFVHAAGVILSQSIADVTESDWDISLAVNVKAGFFLARELSRRFERGASLVMIGSVAGQRASPENLVYAATKAALRSVAGSLAVALAPSGVRVNVVAPGLIATGSTEIATEALSVLRGQPRDEVWRARVQGIPQARPGTVDEVANAVAWLMSDEASYVTGATIPLNGGLLAGS